MRHRRHTKQGHPHRHDGQAHLGQAALLFGAAARRMDYSSLGMTQFLSPTLVFILGVTVFEEPLKPSQLACFAFIWAAIAVFVWDILARRRNVSAQVAPA